MGGAAAFVPPSLQSLAETLVAMANHRGGTLVLPISPKLRAGALIDRVLQAALASDPPLVLPMPQAEAVDGKSAVVVTVPAGLPHVYALDGRYLIRAGDANQPLPPRQLRELLLERGELSFEDEIVTGATLDDLDWAAIEVYAARLGVSSARDLMFRRGCITQRGELIEPKPTNAGVLLFGKDPTRFVRGAHITAVRFAGTEMGDVFTRADISGTLPDQIRRAETFLIDHLRKGVQLGASMARAEQFEYPMEAAREVVVNAVAHRDYSVAGDGVRLFIFADHMEVTSPGKLAGPVTLANIAEERFSRNSIIVQVLSDLGFIERLGYGIDRILSLMNANGLPAPEFLETSGGFRVTFRRTSAPALHTLAASFSGVEMNPRQQAAVSFMAAHSRITNKDLQELFPDVHSETLRRDLADLVAKGVFEKHGEKRGSYYVLLNTLPQH